MINEMRLEILVRKSTLFAVFLGLIVVVSAPAQTAPTATNNTQMGSAVSGHYRPGHILVRFRTTPGRAVLDQLNIAFGAKTVGAIPEIRVTHLQVPPQAALALLQHLHGRPDVEFAEFDSTVQTFLQPNDPYFSNAYASSHYGSVSQWGPQAVSA